MRLGPVEEHFTAVSALRESRQFGIKHSANVLHVFICSNDLKSMGITSILITFVCCAAVLHSKGLSGTTYNKATPLVFIVYLYFIFLTLIYFSEIQYKMMHIWEEFPTVNMGDKKIQRAKAPVITREKVQLGWFAAIKESNERLSVKSCG